MQKLIKSVFSNFDGTTPSERKQKRRRKCCVTRAIDAEINKILKKSSVRIQQATI